MVVLHKACSTVPGTQSALAVLVVNTPLFQMKTLCDAQGRTLELKETQLSSFMDKEIGKISQYKLSHKQCIVNTIH